jgi:hypothetical protein
MEETYWLSSEKMTVIAICKNGIIVQGSPIIRKFKGQRLVGLINWLEKQGDLRVEKIENIIDIEEVPKCIVKKETG